jgi:hypothetical protein
LFFIGTRPFSKGRVPCPREMTRLSIGLVEGLRYDLKKDDTGDHNLLSEITREDDATVACSVIRSSVVAVNHLLSGIVESFTVTRLARACEGFVQVEIAVGAAVARHQLHFLCAQDHKINR